MVLIDDLVIGLGAGITTTALIILFVLLAQYRRLVEESRKSIDLAKNIYDSMNGRFATQDTRIIDLMARLDIYQVTQKPSLTSPPPAKSVTSASASQSITKPAAISQPVSRLEATTRQLGRSANLTEATILRSLVEGPKTPNQIKAIISASKGHEFTREHTGRLLKGLYDRGLVVRNDQNKPFVYEITEAGSAYLSAT